MMEVSLKNFFWSGVIGVIFFTFCAIMSFLSNLYWPSFCFMIFVALGVYIILNSGKIIVNDDEITVVSLLGVYRINFDEITEVTFGYQGAIVLKGINKHLVLPAQQYWGKANREKAFDRLAEYLEINEININDSFMADFTIHKNVKVLRVS